MNAWRSVCVALTGLMLIGVAMAREQRAVPAQSAVAPKEVFHVYGGWLRCGRPLLGTFQSIDEAARAAEKIRSEKKETDVEIALHTNGTYGIDLHAVEYRVYRNPCKGFFLANTVTSAEKLKDIVEQLRKNGDLVEIVPVYARK
jgi:hypothetical protein